jgi:hypothetical protein
MACRLRKMAHAVMIFLGILGEGSIYAMVTFNPRKVRLRKMAGKGREEKTRIPLQKNPKQNFETERGELGISDLELDELGNWDD